jgi:hypothetical protein
VDERDEGDDVFDFIGLQVTDEVPLYVLRQGFVLVAHLEGMVFAENALTGIVGFLQVADRLGLADRHQSHRLGQRRSYFFKVFFNHGEDDLMVQK